MKKNILLTGNPGIGKSKLLSILVETINQTKTEIEICQGLLTTEILQNQKRVGFKINESIIAHSEMKSFKKVGRYGIDILAIEKEIFSFKSCFCSHETSLIFYFDEIGKIQLQSTGFKNLISAILNKKNLFIATLSSVYTSKYIEAIKQRNDVTIINVTKENRNFLAEDLPKVILTNWENILKV